MKKLKTLISVMLCAMLVLSLVVPSMASAYQITVTGFENETYDAYKLFDVIYSGEGEDMIAVYKASKTIKEKITALNVTGITFTAVTGENNTFYVTFSGNDVAKNLASELSKVGDATLQNKTTGWGITPISATIAEGETTATIDVGVAGYYFVNTTTGTVCNLTNAVPTAQIEDKNIQPTVEKKVKEGSAWGTNNDGAYGDLVEFETKIRAYKGAENYILHDKMDGNLAFNASSVVVKDSTKTLTKNTDYTIATSNTDNCTFEIVFTAAYLNSIAGTKDAPTIITVTYNANISTTAVADQAMKNETYLTYGENNTRTETKETITKTHDFNLNKTDGDVTISGAEFTLKKGGTLVNLVEIKNGDTVEGYRVATSADTTIVTNIKVGLMNIKGLDSGTYTLHEAVTPAGYNTLTEDVTFTIEANGDVKKGSQVQADDTIEIVNNAGTTLPTTGGMGTKILFTVGGIMMVVAFVLFTSKRRMAAED